MATMASALLRAARGASRAAAAAAIHAAAVASRSASAGAATAAATRAAAMASRSARAAGVAAAAVRAARWNSGVMFPIKSCPSRPSRNNGSTKPRDDARDALCHTSSCADYYAKLSDDGIIPMDKDMESDEAIWALYERWCKTFNKKRDSVDNVEMALRFKIFKYYAQRVHNWNTYVPANPKTAAIYLRKRRQVNLLLAKGEDISHIDDKYAPLELYHSSDGADPFLSDYDKNLLKIIKEKELSELQQ